MPQGGNGSVSYLISLESKQFLAELKKARDEAKEVARDIEQGSGGASKGGQQLSDGLQKLAQNIKRVHDYSGEAGVGLKDLRDQFQGANKMAQAFSATNTAFAQALSGNFVAAAQSATKAVVSLTQAMIANPILLVVAAVAALGVALYNAVKSYEAYIARVRQAREENRKFQDSLYELEHGSETEQEKEHLKKLFGAGGPSKRYVDRLNNRVDTAREAAKRAGDELEAEQTKRRPNEDRIKELQERRDAAKEELENALAVKKTYDDLLAEQRKNRAEIKAENESERRRQELANAEGDPETMKLMYDRMLAETNKKFGSAEAYKGRLADGIATSAEIEARKSLEEYYKKITETTERLAEKAEQEAQKAQAAKEKQDRAREAALVGQKDAYTLTRMADAAARAADEKFGFGYYDRLANGTATQEEIDMRANEARLRGEARQINDADKRERDQAAKEYEQQLKSFRDNRTANVRMSGDPALMEKRARAMFEDANNRWGRLTKDRFADMSREEREQRSTANDLMAEARKIREEKKNGTPWGEGVLSTRGMSVGDVFNVMRGMNGAKIRDPNVDANQETAKNTKDMSKSLDELCKALGGQGVR